ncbi:MAG: hypothetical protein CL493_01995 [Actinobacteria bacterium]|nr:hypothetical protein [Actinomycetota bacterium]|tara:strand:+ start:7123 stop:7347 length:225 start_codon:yes stop_codon:yes gene_type:complete
MNFPNPWITILSFVYIFFNGFIAFQLSRKIVDIYLEKFNTRFFKSLEPIIGSLGFIGTFGGGLLILYFFIINIS